MDLKKRHETQKEETGGRVTIKIQATWISLTF